MASPTQVLTVRRLLDDVDAVVWTNDDEIAAYYDEAAARYGQDTTTTRYRTALLAIDALLVGSARLLGFSEGGIECRSDQLFDRLIQLRGVLEVEAERLDSAPALMVAEFDWGAVYPPENFTGEVIEDIQ